MDAEDATHGWPLLQYALQLKVPFPGVGNDVVLEWRVFVVSGIIAPGPLEGFRPPRGAAPGEGAAENEPASVQFEGGLYRLDLPP